MSLTVPRTNNMTSKQLKLKANEFLGSRKCAQSLRDIVQHFQVSRTQAEWAPSHLACMKGPCEVMCMMRECV